MNPILEISEFNFLCLLSASAAYDGFNSAQKERNIKMKYDFFVNLSMTPSLEPAVVAVGPEVS
jgi:hypothetical protein